MQKVRGGVTAAKGFLAAGVHCGIRKNSKPDLALVFSMTASNAAGVFTRNKVKAAPVLLSMSNLQKGRARVNLQVINQAGAEVLQNVEVEIEA